MILIIDLRLLCFFSFIIFLIISVRVRLQDRFPDSFFKISSYGREFLVMNPDKFIEEFFTYKEKFHEWDIKVIYLVGPQGSGKTNIIRFLIWALCHVYQFVLNGIIVVFTNDIRILGDKRYSKIFKGNKIIVLIIDDAIQKGYDARMSMHGINIDITQKFFQSRHISEEAFGTKGAIFAIFATQSFTRLDASIRDNANMEIFTTYIAKPYFYDRFPREERELIRLKTHDGHFANRFKQRSFAICRTMSDDITTISFPLMPKWVLPYLTKKPPLSILEAIKARNETRPYRFAFYDFNRTIDEKVIITRLAYRILNHPHIKKLLKKHPDLCKLKDFTRGELKGFLDLEAQRIEDKYNITLKNSHFIKAIDKALYYQRLAELRDLEKEPDLELLPSFSLETIKDRIDYCFEVRNVKILHTSDIVSMTGLSRAQIDSTLSKYPHDYLNCIPNYGYWNRTIKEPTERELEAIIKQIPGLNKPPLKKLKGKLS